MSDSNPFDLNDLLVELRRAAVSDTPRAAVKDVLQSALSDPEQVRSMMPRFEEDEAVLFEDDTVSIWYCRFEPGQKVPPHDHQMVATIGLYDGSERNTFFENDPDGLIRESSDIRLQAGDVMQIGPSAIHAVACISEAPCQGIHVYLGRLTTVDRTLFDVPNGARLKFTDENYRALARAD